MSEPSQSTAPRPADAAADVMVVPHPERRTPLCFIVDGEDSIRHFVSLILQGSGVDTMEFPDGMAFRKARAARAPDLIFLDVNLEAQEAIASLEALGRTGFTGAVQLMSSRGSAVLESIKAIGEQHKLRMLPVLKKPFETSTIQKILQIQKLGHAAPVAARLDLAEAIKSGWVEFWYQPKIDLRKKQLVGAETFARVRHPLHGIVTPDSFMPGADDASLLALSELTLASALKDGQSFSKVGVHLQMSVNFAISALAKLPVCDIVRANYPAGVKWPGLVIDVSEKEIIPEIALAKELAKPLADANVKLAIDHFGRGYAALANVKDQPFAEMKLDRSFITDCGTDKVNAPICKTVIELARSVGAVTVGIGIEKASDLLALVSMGCDLGQGFLLGQPMPQERLLALLKQRANVRPVASPVQAPPATAMRRA
jgi:EAL domain-containing protein (putative c-di-GMP-specific phosphodiesterase class I)/FixJ family two-component response regulator